MISLRAAVAVVLASFVTSLPSGCRGGGTSGAPASELDGGAADASPADASGADDRFSMHADRYSRDCVRDDDCEVIEPIVRCSSCCSGTLSVRRGEADAERASVEEACRQPGHPLGGACGLYCAPLRAACFEQTCVKLPADGGP